MERRRNNRSWRSAARSGARAAGRSLAGPASRTRRRRRRPDRRGAPRRVTLDLADAVADVGSARRGCPGRPIVLIDPGHGGRDPGAPGVSGPAGKGSDPRHGAGACRSAGRARAGPRRADPGRRPLPDARAARRHCPAARASLSCRSTWTARPIRWREAPPSIRCPTSLPSAEAARFAEAENASDGALSSEADDSVRALLSDVALREQMEDSAGLAERLLRRAVGPGLSSAPSRTSSPPSMSCAGRKRRPCCSRPAISAMPTTKRG